MLKDETREDLADLAGEATEALIEKGMSEDDALELVADVLDTFIDLPDVVWSWVVERVWWWVKPSSQRMRRRAAKAEHRGNHAKAERLLARADALDGR